jgi:hypothetical protein
MEDIGVNGKIILKQIFKKWDGGMDWVDKAQERCKWLTLVNALTNFWVP